MKQVKKGKKNQPVQKKDFKKRTNKVGSRKIASNETSSSSVRSKRVVMPKQQLEGGDDQISELLIGLRHYNEKKRLDAANGLVRIGASSLPENRFADVLTGLGYCLSDGDDLVRTKASSFLFGLLSCSDGQLLKPFLASICVQIRAALAHVKAPIRLDAVGFLKKSCSLNLFTVTEIQELLRSLIEVTSTLTVTQSHKSRKGSDDAKHIVLSTIEALLNLVVNKKQETEAGYVDSNEWTLSAILTRSFTPTFSIANDIRKLLNYLLRQGEDVARERIEGLAIESGIIEPVLRKPEPVDSRTNSTSKPKRKPAGSVFSKLSALMRDSDSD